MGEVPILTMCDFQAQGKLALITYHIHIIRHLLLARCKHMEHAMRGS